MSNAEERAFERYPDYKEMDGEYVTQINKRKVFTEGYHQAEKDLKLSWKDIVEIETLLNLVRSSAQYKNGYKEVLKRFNGKRKK